MNSYSQQGEDRWICDNLTEEINYLTSSGTGTFVDIGAGDGQADSNTFAFEQMGWQGIAIDPEPRHTIPLFRNRKNPLVAAISNKSGIFPYWIAPHPTLSGFHNNCESQQRMYIPTFTLKQVVEAYGIRHINLLSVDVEGSELEVLCDLGELLPDIVIVEWPIVGKEPLIELFKGYKLVHTNVGNLIFKRKNP